MPFAIATFLGAFLLFLIQPLTGRFVLPWFSGSPAIWTVCLLFFQSSLFVGYLYATFWDGCGPSRDKLLYISDSSWARYYSFRPYQMLRQRWPLQGLR